MNINLQNYFSDSAKLTNNVNVNGDVTTQNVSDNTERTGEISLRDLSAGDVFNGEITNIKNYDVAILLDSGETINATMSQALELNIGDKLLFQVKDKNDSQIFIKPVANNQVSTELVIKSLLSAGLTVNDKNTAIVKELIANGQPIDRQSITNILKLSAEYANEGIDKLVNMTKNGIEVNEVNLKQYDLYSEAKHEITSEIKGFIDDIVDFIREESFTGDSNSDIINTFNKLSGILDGIEGPLIEEKNIEYQNESLENIHNETTAKLNSEETTTQDINTAQQTGMSNNETEMELHRESIITNSDSSMDINTVLAQADKLIDNANSFSKVSEALKFVINSGISLEAAEEFLKKDSVKSKISKLLENKLFIDGERLSENNKNVRDEVEKLYERLEKLTDMVRNNPSMSKDASLTKSAEGIKNSMTFMNELNNIESYVQLPVKFNEGKANGDLYVYNRKKRHLSDSDTLTAFLHLDMEYLGATDVNVSLKNNSVVTKFTLDSYDSEKLVESHLGELKARLEKLGYSASISSECVLPEAINNNALLPLTANNENAVSIKRYTLDIRT